MGWDFSKGSAHKATDAFTVAVQNAGYHLGALMSGEIAEKCTCSIGRRVYGIRIDKGTGDHDLVWDTVYLSIDGGPEFSCGNRCGGRDTLAALYAEDLKELVVH